jgi:hypothetical protein
MMSMMKLLLTASAVIMIAGAASAEYLTDSELRALRAADEECGTQAYHGRHERCYRQVWLTQPADFVNRHRDAIERLIRDGIKLDRIDAITDEQ